MRMTRLLTRTLRQDPAEAETPSHRLMLRAGMISQVAAGVYAYLPLAQRSLRKIEEIIRQEMDAAGGQELRMPALQPLETWQETGRAGAFGQNLFHLKDRRDRDLVLAPTHEEVVTALVRANVQSYRDLPLVLYQIQTKFRDEPRPRAGLIRVREFDMKDAYSFDADEEGLDRSYRRMMEAYSAIYSRCGLSTLAVEADSGAIGGKDSHEFILPAESGEDIILRCQRCHYSANAERATFRLPPVEAEPEQPLEEVRTPGVKTIAALADYLGVPSSKTLKAVFYSADGHVVFVTLRGDLDVNEVKLKNLLKCTELRLATDEELQGAGLVPGFASPIGLSGVHRVGDASIRVGSNFVAGANKPDTHLRKANYPRDFQVDVMADIALARDGHGCPQCGAPLSGIRGIEVGHVFKLGTVFSETLGARYLDREGVQRPITMGCYGIGVGRLLAGAIEQNHDDKGIIFPTPIAPYQVHLVALNVDDPDVSREAEALYQRLSAQGYEVLFDDRVESAGVKLNDADLIGLPVRLLVSPRSLKQRSVELKARRERNAQVVPLEEADARLQHVLGGS
ncbi:MAG: proline--tRNA ligase [Chloroflexi bacterium]|nr:proline--tRNA ligase [Chloroflexota bacterium]